MYSPVILESSVSAYLLKLTTDYCTSSGFFLLSPKQFCLNTGNFHLNPKGGKSAEAYKLQFKVNFKTYFGIEPVF